MQFKRLVFLFCLVPLFLATGCRSFERDYAAARATIYDDPVGGAWEGRWISDRNGHRGSLKAVLQPAGDDQYRARFKATFWKIFSASYDVQLSAEEAAGTETRLSGSTDLGWLAGGVYEYDATVAGDAFEATYESQADHGRFELKRARGSE